MVNRMFSVPRMSRTINPAAEIMNGENPVAEAQSGGNAANPAAGGTSSLSRNGTSHLQLNARPLSAESQIEVRMDEEMEEGQDAFTSMESNLSEEKKNHGCEAVTDAETRMPPQVSEQEVVAAGSSPAKEPTALPDSPEKEGKEEEKAPVSHSEAKKERVVPQSPEEQETVFPQSEPEKEKKAIPSPPEQQPPIPQSQPENEAIPQLLPEKEPSVPQSPLETETSVSQPLSGKEPNVPQLPTEMEPSVPPPLQKEPPVSYPQVFEEPPVPPLSPVTPQQPVTEKLLGLQSFPEKSAALKEHVALRGAPAFREEKEKAIQSGTKAWPEDSSSSVLAHPEPKPAAEHLGGKGASLNDAVEDLTSHLRQVGRASKSAMSSSISSFVKSQVGQVFAHTIDRALEKSEEWLDYCLPVSETDVESSTTSEEERSAPSEDLCKEGCFERINSLSTKVRNRAFRLALHQLKMTRQAASETLPVLDRLLDVLERTRGQDLLSISSIPESLHGLWAQWGSKPEPPKSPKMFRVSSKEPPSIVPEQLELKALDLTRTLAQQMYGTYHSLLPHVTDLPTHLQEKAVRVYENMEELQSHLASSPSLRDLPSSLVIQSRQKMTAAQQNLEEILDFLAQSPAANWLSQPASDSKGKEPTSATQARQPKGRSPETKPREESSGHRQPPSSPRL